MEEQTLEEEEWEGEEDDEGWGEDSDFIGLSEEELAAQDAAFSQEVLTQDMLTADSATHRAGAPLHRPFSVLLRVFRHKHNLHFP